MIYLFSDTPLLQYQRKHRKFLQLCQQYQDVRKLSNEGFYSKLCFLRTNSHTNNFEPKTVNKKDKIQKYRRNYAKKDHHIRNFHNDNSFKINVGQKYQRNYYQRQYKVELLHSEPEIFLIHDFISEEERESIINTALGKVIFCS